MGPVDLYRRLLTEAHDFLEGTLADITPEQLAWDPPGKAFSIGANYVHVLASEDMGTQALLRGQPLLAAGAWADRMGLSEPPPLGPGGDLKAWGQRVKVDLPALRQYARAVYAATDAYLATLEPAALGRPLDLSQFGFGQRTVLFVLTGLLANVSLHTGEISCLKGLQGQKGYPV